MPMFQQKPHAPPASPLTSTHTACLRACCTPQNSGQQCTAEPPHQTPDQHCCTSRSHEGHRFASHCPHNLSCLHAQPHSPCLSAHCTFHVSERTKLTVMLHTAQSAFVGAVAVADLVKSTLGPKGMVSGCGVVLTPCLQLFMRLHDGT